MAEDRLILLVEDDVLIGMMLVDMFDALGYPEPAQATTNEEALAAIASQPVAGALVDINLGDEKGWPVADALAERGIPFAFTSEPQAGDEAVPYRRNRSRSERVFRGIARLAQKRRENICSPLVPLEQMTYTALALRWFSLRSRAGKERSWPDNYHSSNRGNQ